MEGSDDCWKALKGSDRPWKLLIVLDSLRSLIWWSMEDYYGWWKTKTIEVVAGPGKSMEHLDGQWKALMFVWRLWRALTDHRASKNMRGYAITQFSCSDFDGSDRWWRTSLVQIGGSVSPFVWINKPPKVPELCLEVKAKPDTWGEPVACTIATLAAAMIFFVF